MAVVWIVNPFDPLPGDPEPPGRYASLARMLRDAGHAVTWWTATFSHRYKRQLETAALVEAARRESIALRFVETPAYQRHVSLARIRSHQAFARGFERQASADPGPASAATGQVCAAAPPARDMARPELIVASNPPPEAAAAAARVARRLGSRLVVDVQDIWVENFRRVLPPAVRWAWRVLLRRWIVANREAYSAADAVVGVAGPYADQPRQYGRERYRREVIPLGIDLAAFDEASRTGRCRLGEKGAGQVWAIYGGSLSHGYDVLTVARVAREAVRRRPGVRFAFMGRGELEGPVHAIVAGEPRIEMLGFSGQSDWAATLSRCDVGWNAVKPEALIHFPNKVFHYWAGGVAVLNSIPGECAEWVERTGSGLNYRCADETDALRRFEELIADGQALAARRAAARRAAETLWDRRTLYAPYVNLVGELLRGP